jgi:hypothetical protein
MGKFIQDQWLYQTKRDDISAGDVIPFLIVSIFFVYLWL